MRFKWLPWKFFVGRMARAHGFVDPIALLARLRGFAQPSEVAEPIELLRAGVVFHARGLVNSRVIQHNLDWVWPFWIERQFDPRDPAFVPRAFSITQVNLTHRNWTAVGVPGEEELPIVDPRGLVTPFYDGWSLDFWIAVEDRKFLLPSRVKDSKQRLGFENGLTVTTEHRQDGLFLETETTVDRHVGGLICRTEIRAKSDVGGCLVAALRPYNPEGVSFVHKIELSKERNKWSIDGKAAVNFNAPADRGRVSNYRGGDVYIHLRDGEERTAVRCEVGMATAAALFELEPGTQRKLCVETSLTAKSGFKGSEKSLVSSAQSWETALYGACKVRVPDRRIQFLYDAALRTMVLHSPGDVFPGPYTYKRFWFRDAAFIIYALLCAGLTDRAEKALDRFPERQTRRGYFHSQAGEWDSNGQALWIMGRFGELTGRALKPQWLEAMELGGVWIMKKRLPVNLKARHAGLLPAGFSAEHLGPNDYYYWDDFWSIGGLRAASKAMSEAGRTAYSEIFKSEADAFWGLLERNLERVANRRGRPAVPASPYRRLDAGAIGSLAAGYPLKLFLPEDPRLLDTAAFLLDNCFVQGGFFQDMVHAGVNAYLTLHVAQVLLRAGDQRCLDLLSSVGKAASPTGQWPEAIHPLTGGGCMGDGQHVWAAAEWVLMVRNCFVREENGGLILASGIPGSWLSAGAELSFGPAPTSLGIISIKIRRTTVDEDFVEVCWEGNWRGLPPSIEVRIPGWETKSPGVGEHVCKIFKGKDLP